jgi:hypothetical protein
MAKYKEIVYMVLDELHQYSDDSQLTQEHIIFLAGRYRSFLLKQRYSSDLKKQIPESNYQTLCLELEKTEAIDGLPCEGGYYLRTTKEVPATLPLGTTRLYTSGSFYKGDITFVSRDRMRYVGHNDWMKNIIYASLDPSNRIYMTSQNSQFLYLKEAKLTAVFEDSEAASELSCDNDGDAVCDIMEREFPIEDALIAPLIELVVKELQPVVTAPEDEDNDADDSLSTKGKD